MRVDFIFHVRDARGLSTYEKLFLMLVESRGVMYSRWETAADDLGASRNTFYRTAKGLEERGLLKVTQVGRKRHYEVDAAAVAALVPVTPRSHTGNESDATTNQTVVGEVPGSHRGKARSLPGKARSLSGQLKENTKKHQKGDDASLREGAPPRQPSPLAVGHFWETRYLDALVNAEDPGLQLEVAELVEGILHSRAERPLGLLDAALTNAEAATDVPLPAALRQALRAMAARYDAPDRTGQVCMTCDVFGTPTPASACRCATWVAEGQEARVRD